MAVKNVKHFSIVIKRDGNDGLIYDTRQNITIYRKNNTIRAFYPPNIFGNSQFIGEFCDSEFIFADRHITQLLHIQGGPESHEFITIMVTVDQNVMEKLGGVYEYGSKQIRELLLSWHGRHPQKQFIDLTKD